MKSVMPSARRSRRRPHRARLAVAGACAVVATCGAVGLGVANASPADSPAGTTAATFTGAPGGGITFATPTGLPPIPPGPGSTAERQVFAVLNQQRAAHGLAALTWSPQLAQAALTHNRAMAAVDVLSHQLPGEPDLGTRISATGYRWQTAAENIGWISQLDDAGAVAIQGMFYNETPPNDGHRLNILSTSSRQVGVSVYLDGKGKLWVTEDFGSPK